MNRRELFKTGGYLLAGAACARLVRLFPAAVTGVPYVVGERGPELFRPRIGPTYTFQKTIWQADRAMRQSVDRIENVTRSLGKFEKELGKAQTGKHSI